MHLHAYQSFRSVIESRKLTVSKRQHVHRKALWEPEAVPFFLSSEKDFFAMTAGQQSKHPLDPLTTEEIRAVSTIIRKERLNEIFVVSSISLKEPPKDRMMAFLGWDTSRPKPESIEREALAIVMDRPSGLVHEMTVSLTQAKITDWKRIEGMQPTMHVMEMLEAESVMIKDERVIEECRNLGITDMKKVFIDAWGVGYHEIKDKRLMQGLVYYRNSPDDNQYAHPLDIFPLYST